MTLHQHLLVAPAASSTAAMLRHLSMHEVHFEDTDGSGKIMVRHLLKPAAAGMEAGSV